MLDNGFEVKSSLFRPAGKFTLHCFTDLMNESCCLVNPVVCIHNTGSNIRALVALTSKSHLLDATMRSRRS